MRSVRNVLLVHLVRFYSFCTELPFQQEQEPFGKLVTELAQVAARVVGEQQQLPLMRLRHCVTLEAILVAALFAAHLTKPSQLLQSFGLDLVGYVLRSAGLSATLSHRGS